MGGGSAIPESPLRVGFFPGGALRGEEGVREETGVGVVRPGGEDVGGEVRGGFRGGALADEARDAREAPGAFVAPFPARSCVQAAALPRGARLEVEAIAVRPS